MFLVLFWIIAAYLIGSVSTAILFSRFQGLPDPREHGSGNPGATNVLRLGGKKAAAVVLLGDALKGALPVWLASLTGVAYPALAWIILAATLGHIFPLFFHFRGGKGVATAWGGLIALSLPLGLLLAGTWVIVAAITRYSSLAALITVILAPFYTFWIGANVFPIILLSAILIWRHKDNIQRLYEGKESKI
jgi:acyl phosphate:glycerol-3-phosphate acyltransferase